MKGKILFRNRRNTMFVNVFFLFALYTHLFEGEFRNEYKLHSKNMGFANGMRRCLNVIIK